MVPGDIYIADGVSVLNEGDSYPVVPPADADVEITNIYAGGALRMEIISQVDSTLLSLGTISESQLSINIHLDESVLLQLINDGPDPVTVAIDGIYTRRPPTVFA